MLATDATGPGATEANIAAAQLVRRRARDLIEAVLRCVFYFWLAWIAWQALYGSTT